MEKGTSFIEFFANGMKVPDLIKVIKGCCCGLLHMLGDKSEKYGCYMNQNGEM